MANNDQNDKELNDYLNGDSDLSKAYRASNKLEPAAHLDQKILLAAKESVRNSEQIVKPKFHRAPWVKPVSIAAMITLSVSLVVTMQQESGQPLISEPKIEMYDSASFIETEELSETIISNDEMVIDRAESEKYDVPEKAPAALGAVGGYRQLYKQEEKRQHEGPASATLSTDGAALNEVELKQSIDQRANVPEPNAGSVATDMFSAEEIPAEALKRKKEVPAKKMLLKEKASAELYRERKFPDDKVKTMEADDGFSKEDIELNEIEKQEQHLKDIKALWESGEFVQSKLMYDEFKNNYPDYDINVIKELFGLTIYNELIIFKD
jgi:hypothetical protein